MSKQVERVLAIEARKAARRFNLRAGDAIHLATALQCGAGKLLTYDTDLLKLEGAIIRAGSRAGCRGAV